MNYTLHLFSARYYDPSTGRFLSEDPIHFEGGDLNLYRYVFSNPLIYTDPSGHNFLPGLTNPGGTGGAIGAVVGAVVGGAIGSVLAPGYGTYVGGFIGGQIGGTVGSFIGGGNSLDPNADIVPRPPMTPISPPTGPLNPSIPAGGYNFLASPRGSNSCTPSYTDPVMSNGR